ncbi:hypothetical protein BDV95DRAFT_605845 [Massariosphaeria phaeospora]|uniref:Uncharacterized protein n=1 Tax=Massariosphaeria phaeospora TaxID=100035 RepID=A0A7C8MRK5_9PLEO|nr:hypothetical protein BDV95DRAFT_605845 [Massariosphaeria phaeospora]
MTSAPADSSSALFQRIHDLYQQKPNFTQYIGQSDPVSDHHADKFESPLRNEHSTAAQVRRCLFNTSGGNIIQKRKKIPDMPVHPAEENVSSGSITDQVAKESSDSTASTAPMHQEDNKVTSGGSVSANAHKANPGPVMAQDIGKPASKEELKKRVEELNK